MGLKNYQAPISTLAAQYLAKTDSSLKYQIVADMIRISCVGICGVEDFRWQR
jgi:hypothetical protein